MASAILRSILIGTMKLSDGIEALEALEHLGINIQTIRWSDLREILSLAAATKLTVYDSIYLHLSRKIGAQLLTADSQLKQKGENVAEVILLEDMDPTKIHKSRNKLVIELYSLIFVRVLSYILNTLLRSFLTALLRDETPTYILLEHL